MSKIADKLIEIGELIGQGMEPNVIAAITGVPVDWVIEAERTMMIIDEGEQE
jgi:hypothetical protein